MKKPTVDWSHKWQCFYLVHEPTWQRDKSPTGWKRKSEREQITHALAKHIWDTDFCGAHWTPAAFRIMQEIVLA